MDAAAASAHHINSTFNDTFRGRGRGRGRDRGRGRGQDRGQRNGSSVNTAGQIIEHDTSTTNPPNTGTSTSENVVRDEVNSLRPRRGGRSGRGSGTPGDRHSINLESSTEYKAVPMPPRRRGARFNAALTNTASQVDAEAGKRPRSRARRTASPTPERDDLTSRLTRSLSKPPFIECPICFNAIRPAQATWSCSPSVDGSASTQCCWATFHLPCVRAWAKQNVEEVVEARRARGDEPKGEWRCPGCQTKRETVPFGYRYVRMSRIHTYLPMTR